MQNERIFLLSPHRAREKYLIEQLHPLLYSITATVLRTGIKEPQFVKELGKNVQVVVVLVVVIVMVALHVK